MRRLTFIRPCRQFGFGIWQIRDLASLMEDRSRSYIEARDVAENHLIAVRASLKDLMALEQTIADCVDNCEICCTGGPLPDGVIPMGIADHAAPAITRCRLATAE